MSEDANKIPNHVAIVPDGNRRWAKKNGLQPWDGHRKGAENLEDIINEALRLEVKNITFWGSSEDNLKKRSLRERRELLKLYEEYFSKLISSEQVYEKKARIRVFGKWAEQFPGKLVSILKEGMEKTKSHSNYCLNFLLAYNGDSDMLEGVKNVAKKVKGDAEKISNQLLRENLMTSSLPDVDLLIRTGVEGDPHNSAGLLMWQTQNSQYHFSSRLFPDFQAVQFREAVKDFAKRARRLGK